VTHTVSELYGERLFRRLSLIVVECLLIGGIVGSGLVGGLHNHEGIPGGVDCGSLIAGSYAGRVRLDAIVCEARRGQPGKESRD
jgi:hypothetical protein